jgi:hypothetical protein
MKREYVRIWNNAIVACFSMMSLCSSREIGYSLEQILGCEVSPLKFEPCTLGDLNRYLVSAVGMALLNMNQSEDGCLFGCCAV